MVLLNKKNLFNKQFIFYTLSIIISIIPTYYLFQLLFHSPLSLPGNDPTAHITIIRGMIETRSIFVPYQKSYLTSENVGYYPALWQGLIALFNVLTGINEVVLIRYFISSIFLLGAFSYWRLFREFFKDNYSKIVFIYFILMFNVAPIIKTIRDGSYGQTIVTWFLLPNLLFFILRRNLFSSSIILFFIIGTHNLSTIMTGAVVFSFLIYYISCKKFDEVKFLFKLGATTLLPSLPFLYYNYYLTIIKNALKSPDRFNVISFNQYSRFLTEPTLYIGIFCVLIILIYYNNYRWVSLWYIFYTILAYSPFGSGRIIREMCIPLSISIGIVLYDLANTFSNGIKINIDYNEKVKKYNVPKNRSIKLIILVVVGLLFLKNGVGPITVESEPNLLDYFTQSKGEAYNWLNQNTTNSDNVIVYRGLDSWGNVYLNQNVIGLFSSSVGLSIQHGIETDELNSALLNPQKLESLLTFEKYNISYFILSKPLTDRWYPFETQFLSHTLLNINYEESPFYKLVYYNDSKSELIKIYKIIYTASPQVILIIPSVSDNSIILKDNTGEESIQIRLWETRFVYNTNEEIRLFGHLNVKNLYGNYTVNSKILTNSSVMTFISFTKDSHSFTYQLITKTKTDFVIINLSALYEGNNFTKMQISLSPISSNYTLYNPNSESIKFDSLSNFKEDGNYKVISIDNNVTVIINTNELIVFDNMFQWNIIRTEFLTSKASLDIIIIKNSSVYLKNNSVYIIYNNSTKLVQEFMTENINHTPRPQG